MQKSLALTFMVIFIICKGELCKANSSDLIEHNINMAKKFKYEDSDSAIFYLETALELCKDLKNIEKRVSILFSLATATIRSGDFIHAIEYCNQAKELSLTNKLINDYVKSIIYTGNVYRVVGLTSEALNILLDLHYNNNELKSQSAENYLALNYYLALCYSQIGEIKKSKKYLKLNLIKNKEFETLKLVGSFILFSNLSSKPDTIRRYLNEAEKLLNKHPDANYEFVAILSRKAILNKALGNLKESKVQYIEAIKIAQTQGYRSYLSNLYNNYAYQLMAENNMDSAAIVLQQALTISQQIEDNDLEASVLDSYSDYYKAIGSYAKALEYKNNSVDKRNEYRRKQQIQQSLFLSTVFETEQKEKEIIEQESKINQFQAILFATIAFIVFLLAILVYYRQKSAVRKARLLTVEREKSLEVADALIEGQDTERKCLAMDLHDGLGARLGALRFKIDNYFGSTPHYEEITSDVDKIGKNIRELSHRMLPTQLEELGLIPSLQNLFNSINQSEVFHIELETDITDRMTSKMETNIYYLIYELINNALKHSGGNEIFVQLLNHDDSINLSVEDNGKGFDPVKTSDGLGLMNIKQRVAYLSGEIHVDTQTSQGTLFMIEIPINTND